MKHKPLFIILTNSLVAYISYAQYSFVFIPTLITIILCTLVIEHLITKIKQNEFKQNIILVIALSITALLFLTISWYIGFSNLFLVLNNNILISAALINLTIFIISQLTSTDFLKKIYKNIEKSIKYILISLIAGIHSLKEILNADFLWAIFLLICISLLILFARELYTLFAISTLDLIFFTYSYIQEIPHYSYFFIKGILIALPYIAISIACIFSLILISNNLCQTYRKLKTEKSTLSVRFIISSLILTFSTVVLFKLNLSSLTIPYLISTIIACLSSTPIILSIIGAWLFINIYKYFYDINNDFFIDEKVFNSAKQTLAFLLSIIDSAAFNIPSILLFGKDTIIKNKNINNHILHEKIRKYFLDINSEPQVQLYFKDAINNAKTKNSNYQWENGIKDVKNKILTMKTSDDSKNSLNHNIVNLSENLILKPQEKYTCPITYEDIVEKLENDYNDSIVYEGTFSLIDTSGTIFIIEKESYNIYLKTFINPNSYDFIRFMPHNPYSRLPIIFKTETTNALFKLIKREGDITLKAIKTIMKLEKTNTQLTDTEIERIIQLSNDHNNLTSTALVAIIKLEKTSPKLSETEIERIIQLSNDHNNLTSTALVTIIKLEKTKPQLSETAIIGIIKSLNKTNYYIKLSFIVGLHIGVIISQLFALNLILTTLSTAILTSTLTSMIYKGLKNEQFYKLVFQPLAFSAFVNLFLFFILTTNPVLSSLITSKSLLVTTMLMISSLSLTLSKNLYSRYNKSFSENLKYSLWNNRLKPLLKQLYNLFYLKFINLFCNTALLLASTFFILLLLTFPLIAFLILCIQQFICYIMFTILAMIFNITYYIAIPSLAFIYFSQIIYSYDKIFNIFKEYCNFIENHISIKLETITISFICILSIASYVINPTKSFNILIQNIYLCFANPLLLTTIIITSLLISLCIENYKNNKNNDSIIEKLITSILNTLDLLLCTISCPILLLTPLFLQQTLFYIICAIRSLLFGSKSFEIYDKDLSTTDIENHLPNYLKTTHTELSNTFNLSEQKAPEAMA